MARRRALPRRPSIFDPIDWSQAHPRPWLLDAAEPGDDGAWSFGSASAVAWASPYPWGDAFPAQTTPCGWALEDIAVPLLDPLPCTASDGSLESNDLRFALKTGTTQTTVIATGVFRMYFGAASLQQAATDKANNAMPVYDPGGREKFAIDADGVEFPAESAEWYAFWANSGSDYTNLHFSSDYVGYLDSTDGITFPMYAPIVSPTSGSDCDDADYSGATGTLVDAASGFWAGWHSTSIRATGASVVYRDVSVVYLSALARYLMFAVECDGSGQAPDGSGGNVVDVDGCTCVPSSDTDPATWPLLNNHPKTRYVFFTCTDADFGSNTMGPFPVAPVPPDYTVGQWIGVPQAFLSPDQQYLLFYVGGRAYVYSGMHVARVRDLAADIATLEAMFSSGVPTASLPPAIYHSFVNLGVVSVDCLTPASGTTPMPTDEQFTFDSAGRLHLYFSNRDAYDAALPLRLISHAAALADWDASVIEALIEPPVVAATKTTVIDELPRCHFQKILGLPCPEDTFIPSGDLWQEEEEESPATAADMLVNFKMVNCDPVYMSDLLGATSFTDAHGFVHNVEVNDPNVYRAKSGEYVMIIHCDILGGLVRLTADSATASDTTPQC